MIDDKNISARDTYQCPRFMHSAKWPLLCFLSSMSDEVLCCGTCTSWLPSCLGTSLFVGDLCLMKYCVVVLVLVSILLGHYHVFVGDLSPDVNADMLRTSFSEFGEVT